jgi:hypothetical protein
MLDIVLVLKRWDQDSVKQPTQDDQVLGVVGLQLEES